MGGLGLDGRLSGRLSRRLTGCLSGHLSGSAVEPFCGLVDAQIVCPAVLQIPCDEEEMGGVSTRYLAPGGQIQCQSINMHRGKV